MSTNYAERFGLSGQPLEDRTPTKQLVGKKHPLVFIEHADGQKTRLPGQREVCIQLDGQFYRFLVEDHPDFPFHVMVETAGWCGHCLLPVTNEVKERVRAFLAEYDQKNA